MDTQFGTFRDRCCTISTVKKAWSSQTLILTNHQTNYGRTEAKQSGGVDNLRQIDYVIVSKWRLQNVFSSYDLHVGEDHRTLTATFQMKKKGKSKDRYKVMQEFHSKLDLSYPFFLGK